MKPQMKRSSIGIIVAAIALVTGIGIPLAHVNAPSLAQEPDMDNIYHEDDNLPDDADVFPRMGKIEGIATDYSNCRSQPWGQVVASFSGDSFMEIDERIVDRNGESWFRNAHLGCWIHDSRIDLL